MIRRGDRLTLFFDGGCRPNPGPMETAVVRRGVARVRRDWGIGDSGTAEWLGLRHAIEFALVDGADDVLFVGDAATVIRQALDLRQRDDRFRAHRLWIGEALSAIPRVQLRWVRRSRNPAGFVLERLRWENRPGR